MEKFADAATGSPAAPDEFINLGALRAAGFGKAQMSFQDFTALSLPGAATGHFWRGGGTAGATRRARDFGGNATRERASQSSKSLFRKSRILPVGAKQGSDLSARHWRIVLGLTWRYAAASASLKMSLAIVVTSRGVLPRADFCVLFCRFIVAKLRDVAANFKTFNREELPKFFHPLLASAGDTLFTATWFAASLKKIVFVQNFFSESFTCAMIRVHLSSRFVDISLAHGESTGRFFKRDCNVSVLQIRNVNISNRGRHRAGEFSAAQTFRQNSSDLGLPV